MMSHALKIDNHVINTVQLLQRSELSVKLLLQNSKRCSGVLTCR
jgi:hypothetical protein